MTLKYIECDLCGMLFSKRFPDLVIRMNKHTEFHSKARIQKRNTTQGIPQYIETEKED